MMHHELMIVVVGSGDHYTSYSVECDCGLTFAAYTLPTPSTLWCDAWIIDKHADHVENVNYLPPNWLELVVE